MQPKKGHGQDLMKGLEMKTKKYNSKESDPRIYTFAIRASQRGNMQGLLRMSYGESLGDLPIWVEEINQV